MLVPVVVRDAQGNSVTGLKQEDFKVFDNGKPREVSGFTVEKRAGANAPIQNKWQSTNPKQPIPAPARTADATRPNRRTRTP